MAEIRVEPRKRSLAWLWILLVLVILAAAAWYFLYGGRERLNGAMAPNAAHGDPIVAVVSSIHSLAS